MQERLMVFVDGSNLLRATGTKISAVIRSDKPDSEALELCTTIVRELINRIKTEAWLHDCKLVRTYWFASSQGNEEYERDLRRTLRSYGMEPMVFKKRHGKEKRVDIAIPREMLINAVNGNYDLGLLVAGDADYLDLINDLKRLGVRVIGSFYDVGLSEDLKLAFDSFHELHVWGHRRRELVSVLGGKLPT